MHKYRYLIYFFTLFGIVAGTILPPITVVLVNDLDFLPLTNCEVNESYTDCGNLCEVTSQNYGEPLTDDPFYHKEKCIAGCYCILGYLRNSQGNCVLDHSDLQKESNIKQYKICKDPNEIYRRCGQYCQQYCNGPHCVYPEKAITPSGCYCRKNYERDEVTGVCLRRNSPRCINQAKRTKCKN